MNDLDIWTFLKRYYHDEILQLGSDWPHSSSLTIDLLDVQKYNIEYYESFVLYPSKTIYEIEAVLKEWEFPFDTEPLFNPAVRINSNIVPIRIRDIRHSHMTQLVTIRGIVQKATEVMPKITSAVFECMKCGHMNAVFQSSNVFVAPFECDNEMCGRRGPFKLNLNDSEFIDSQKIRMQESPEELKGGEQPQSIDIELSGDITGKIQPGNRIICTGILKSIQQTTKQSGKTPLFIKYLDCVYIEYTETDIEVVISDEDMVKIKEISAMPDVTKWLTSQFSQSIYGYSMVKEALLVSAVSGENSTLSDGSIQRGYTHVLIVGDPSTAKSTMLKNLKQLIPGAQFATGDGATKAGLTAAAVRDEFYGSKWSIEAGALVLADKSVAIVDELDKIREEDIPKLNTALSSSAIPINKAGISTTLWARCSIICAMNPKNGRFSKYDDFSDITDQIRIRADTLSRFDLVYLMRDIPHKSTDANISETLVTAWCGEFEGYDIDLLQKYLAVARTISKVTIPEDIQQIIKEYYQGLRAGYKTELDTIPITTRNLEALIRLTRAEAKLRLSSTADINDVNRAINLIKESMNEICTDENGNIDADIIEVGQGKSQRELAKLIIDTIRNYNGGCQYADVALMANDKNISVDRLDSALKRLKREGTIFEPKHGYLRCM